MPELLIANHWPKFYETSESHSVVSDSLWSHGLYSPWNSLDQNIGVGSLSLLQGIFPTQGSNTGLLHCRSILYHWATGKPKNTGAGSLFLLQWIFLTQESNWALLHWMQNLYQLSYQGSPFMRPKSVEFTHRNKIIRLEVLKPSHWSPARPWECIVCAWCFSA